MKKTPPHLPVFSIIIPSYNEGEDARIAIEAALAQRYPHKEIIVVDDSKDSTRDIIREYVSRGVKLLDGPRKGCCEAINLAITRATGDIVVAVNADVAPEPDFLERIAKHYEAGADWVLVESKGYNLESLHARFIQAQHDMEEGPDSSYNPYASEGYSCRRDAALAVGMQTGDYPVKFCRDWTLGEKLTKAGYKKVFDRSIVVPHKSPDNFREYWNVRKTRGRFMAPLHHFMWGYAPLRILLKLLVKHTAELIKVVTVVPTVWRVARVAAYSEHPVRDFFPFLYVHLVQVVARAVGEWEGWRVVVRFLRKSSEK